MHGRLLSRGTREHGAEGRVKFPKLEHWVTVAGCRRGVRLGGSKRYGRAAG